ncbi:hypothetical protein C0Z18_14940 [Trinickia dabaoshanensis]|uniref:Signal peptidase n=1 Tax=Trinickia dabaoshanensis TaxID=564714 RepID=A0A2N7VPM9_9BURK|nr:heavy metal-binding domain-containing protein [Trinickia dabaoshanensis]PMS19111.1 hypothetical protein C0Z18_14940 [Trinickia dabaoshanensis]
MKLKHLIALAAAALGAQAALAGSHTTTYPLKPVLDAQSADSKVAFYFGDAAHPAVSASLGEKTEGIRIARKTDDETTACNEALKQALDALRKDATDAGANAVINIETSFHQMHTASATEFTCATSMSAAALKVHGQLVKLDAK